MSFEPRWPRWGTAAPGLKKRDECEKVIELEFKQAATILNGQLRGGRVEGARFRGVSIDSRTIASGALFFAIQGERLDGHQFIEPAISAGAAGVVMSDGDTSGSGALGVPSILVSDTHASLIELAVWRRKQLRIATMGVTGSVGKTTVKEMIGHLLRSAGVNPYVSEGNLNNLYGLPLSILRAGDEHQCGVFELGISRRGEMSQLAPVLNPQVGVITNISRAHTELLGDVCDIRREKAALLDNLPAEGIAVLPADDSKLLDYAHSRNLNVVTFAGISGAPADVEAKNVRVVTVGSGARAVTCDIDGSPVILNTFGLHQAQNAACAVAACKALGYDVAPGALSDFQAEKNSMRGEVAEFGNIHAYLDCYNANPESMKSGIESFAEVLKSGESNSAILVLGDMLELGEVSQEEHERLADVICKSFLNSERRDLLRLVVLVGSEVSHTARRLSELSVTGKRIVHCETHSEAVKELESKVASGDNLYFKASRGIALERVYLELRKRLEGKE